VRPAWEEGKLPTKPLPVAMIDSFITYLTSDSSHTLAGLGEAIHCRAAGWPSVLKFVWALTAFEASLNLICLTKSPKLVQRLRQLRRLHVTEGARPFDIMDLKLIHEALMADFVRNESEDETECDGADCSAEAGGCPKCGRANPFSSGLKRTQMWCMLLWQLALCGRGSEVSEYCFLFENIRLPPKDNPEEWCKDGLPLYIEVLLTKWKWSRGGTAVRPRSIVLAWLPANSLTPASRCSASVSSATWSTQPSAP